MLTDELTIQLLNAMCECETNIQCAICKVKEKVEDLQKQLMTMEEIKANNTMFRRQNKAMRVVHVLHLDALNSYYHLLHKQCPCKTEVDGKCESPWLNVVRTK